MTRFGLIFLVPAALGLGSPARAECMGACADGLFGVLLAFVVYGGLGLVVLVMLARARWRRGGVRLLIGTVLLAVGLPLLSQAWQDWKHRGMEGREIIGTLPDLSGKVPVLLSDGALSCYSDVCALVLWGAGEAGIHALSLEALAGLDAGTPLALADLPLELWQRPAPGSSEVRSRLLTPEERQQVAGRIDYLVLARKSWFADAQGPVEAALRQRPEFDGLRSGERAHIALGPVAGGKLDLVGMDFDLLDLWLFDRALALILAPYNRQDAGNRIANRQALADLLCPRAEGIEDWTCDYALP